MQLHQPVDKLSSFQLIDNRNHAMLEMITHFLFVIVFFVQEYFQDGAFIFVFEVSWLMVHVFMFPLGF